MNIRNYAGGLLASAALIGSAQAAPVTYSFTKIASTNDGYTFLDNTASINNNGEVAFWARPEGISEGIIYVYRGGGIQEVVPASGIIDSPSINDDGVVAYRAFLSGGGQAINKSDGTTVTEVANTTGVFRDFDNYAMINNDGLVAFSGRSDTGERFLYVGDGETISEIPDSSSAYAYGAGTSINDNGEVAFFGFLTDGGEVIGVSDGSATRTVVVATGNDRVNGLPVINDHGDVAFVKWSNVNNKRAILFSDGTTTQELINTDYGFLSLGGLSINNSGDVAFRGTLASNMRSINVISDGLLNEVIRTGDVLSGLVITTLNIGHQALNDSNSLVFSARFSDGSVGIYRADVNGVSEVPLPAALPLFLAGLAGLGAARRRKRGTNAA